MSEERIAELEEAIETLSVKNRELLGEVKVAKAKAKGVEIDPAEYAALQNENDALKTELTSATKDSTKQIESLQATLSEKDGALQSYLIDNGLNDAMIKAGIKPEFMSAAKAMLRSETQIKAEDGKYSALMGEKPLFEAITEWAASDEGKHFVSAPANSGGGATGGNGNTSSIAPKGNLGGDKGQRVNAIKNMFPDLQ
jgi:HD superfamily phosphohydrolase